MRRLQVASERPRLGVLFPSVSSLCRTGFPTSSQGRPRCSACAPGPVYGTLGLHSVLVSPDASPRGARVCVIMNLQIWSEKVQWICRPRDLSLWQTVFIVIMDFYFSQKVIVIECQEVYV